MRRFGFATHVGCVSLLIILGLSTTRTIPAQAQTAAGQFLKDELKVKFRPSTAQSTVDQVNSKVGGTIIDRSIGDPDLYRIKLPAGTDLDSAIRTYTQDPNVVRATKIPVVIPSETVPNDPYFALLLCFLRSAEFS